MLIKESDIRRLIRHAILSEITGPRIVNSIDTMKEDECEYYREIPAQFARLFSSGTFAEMSDTLAKEFPELAGSLGILGIGSSAGAIVNNVDPGNIGDITKMKNGAQILFSYINTYLYASGMGCLQFYYLGLGLDFLAFLLGVGKAPGENSVPSQKNLKGLGDLLTGSGFRKAIAEKSLSLATNSDGFVNNYPFYALPSLASKGPEYTGSDNVALLNSDLKAYEIKINKIKNIRASRISVGLNKITNILDIKNTKKIKEINITSDIDRDDIELVSQLKTAAIVDLIVVLGDAGLNYKFTMDAVDHREFKEVFHEFVRRIS